MLINYLRIALRNLGRYKGFALVNITGLAVGVACCLLIVLYVRDELAYDRFHDNASQIARLVRTRSALSAGPMAPALAADLPGITHTARLDVEDAVPLRTAAGDRFTERLFFADSSFFTIFRLPFVQGDPATALARPDAVVLTETAARRIFGTANPMGQTLVAEGGDESAAFTVTGIVEDVPRQAHFRFEVMASFAYLAARSGRMENWSTNWLYTYLLLDEGVDAQAVTTQLPAFFERHTGEAWDHFRVQPLLDIHLRSTVGFEIEPQGRIGLVYVFSVIALLVLVIAGINFINLTTARAARRAREVGLRKALGAQRAQLVTQFVGEAMVLAFGAVVVAVVLSVLCLPAFNSLAQKTLPLDALINVPFLAVLALATVLLGLAAGSYPALVLSGYQPIEALKRHRLQQAEGRRLREGLVVFQFTASAILIIGTLVVMQQRTFMAEAGLGFDQEQVVVLNVGHEHLGERFALVKAELARHPNVVHVSATSNVPGQGVSDFIYRPEGLEGDLDAFPAWDTYFIDGDVIETLGMTLTQGRAFDLARPGDENTFLLNEAAVNEMRVQVGDTWADPVGKQIDFYMPGQDGWEVQRSGTVVGVVQDFHYRSLHEAIGPLVLQMYPPGFDHVFVKIRTTDIAGTLAFLEAQHQALAPGRPFEYVFLDAFFDSLYRAEQRVGRLFSLFAALAVVIACMGLYGLAAFMAEQRTKEIGVRKVFGATEPGIVALLLKDFARLVVIATALAIPVAYYGMQRWLSGFAYRVDLGAGVFLAAAALVFGIALLTVSYQALRAARADPAESLRYE